MSTRIRVGAVEVRTSRKLKPRQIRALLGQAAVIATMQGDDDEPGPPIGFTALVERLPDDMADPQYDPD